MAGNEHHKPSTRNLEKLDLIEPNFLLSRSVPQSANGAPGRNKPAGFGGFRLGVALTYDDEPHRRSLSRSAEICSGRQLRGVFKSWKDPR